MLYGIDSSTLAFPTGASTKDFYIGRLGIGTTPNTTHCGIRLAQV
jgi:hypothetical protein